MNWKKYLPILEWLPNYPAKNIPTDVLAGITVGIMVIPQGMAYGMLAGLPPVYGLYASLVPMLIYVLLGTSRQLILGPTAMVSLLILSGLNSLAEPNTAEYIGLVIVLSFCVGLVQFLFGLLKLGFFINFLSHPVLSGFISAAAILIIISQLKNLTGTQYEGSWDSFATMWDGFSQYMQHIDLPTFVIGITGIFMTLLLRKIKKTFPSPLVLLILSIGLLYFYHTKLPTVAILGIIPEGLPDFILPVLKLESINALMPSILTVSLIGILESIAIAKVMQAKNKNYELVPNQELCAYGIANMIGSLFQSYPTAGSVSRTAVNDDFEAKSGISAIVSVIIVIFTLLFLTPLFYYLPISILAAIIVVAVIRLIDIKEVLFLWKSDRIDCGMLLLTFFATLFIGVEQGILIGIFVSLLMVLYKTTRPHISIMGRIPGTPHYKNIQVIPDLIIRSEVLVIRPDAPLFFANISFFKETLQKAVAEKQTTLKLIVFNAECIPELDSSAAQLLKEILLNCQKESISFYFTGIAKNVYGTLKNSEVLSLLGGNFLFHSVQDAIDYFDKQVSKATSRGLMPSNKEQ